MGTFQFEPNLQAGFGGRRRGGGYGGGGPGESNIGITYDPIGIAHEKAQTELALSQAALARASTPENISKVKLSEEQKQHEMALAHFFEQVPGIDDKMPIHQKMFVARQHFASLATQSVLAGLTEEGMRQHGLDDVAKPGSTAPSAPAMKSATPNVPYGQEGAGDPTHVLDSFVKPEAAVLIRRTTSQPASEWNVQDHMDGKAYNNVYIDAWRDANTKAYGPEFNQAMERNINRFLPGGQSPMAQRGQFAKQLEDMRRDQIKQLVPATRSDLFDSTMGLLHWQQQFVKSGQDDLKKSQAASGMADAFNTSPTSQPTSQPAASQPAGR